MDILIFVPWTASIVKANFRYERQINILIFHSEILHKYMSPVDENGEVTEKCSDGENAFRWFVSRSTMTDTTTGS
jgi:hypothetical protein